MFMVPLSHRNRLCNPDAKMQHGFNFSPHAAAVIPGVRIGGDVVHSFVIVNRRGCPKLPGRGPVAREAAGSPGAATSTGAPAAASSVAPGGVVRWHGARVDPALL